MKPVGALDQVFLWLERRNQPMHVGGLILVRPPEGEAEGFAARVVERMRTATVAEPPFNQRLVRWLGGWFWDEDPQFDLDAHLHHLSLPAPGRIRELLALVSRLHGAMLDRGKPLWEMTIIDGLEDGRVAIYSKVHHAMVDGVGAMRMMVKMMSTSPDDTQTPPLWTLPARTRRRADESTPRRARSPLAMVAEAIAEAREGAASLPKVAKEVYRSFSSQRGPDEVSVFQAPTSLLNQKISASRRFAAQSFSLPRIKAVGKAYGATVNDVTLAMCASALRRYLMELRVLPTQPLIAMVPVSMRRDDSDSGNQIAIALSTLATDVRDPVKRLEVIVRAMRHNKERFSRMSQAEVMAYLSAVLAFNGVHLATGLFGRWKAYNVIISNVPGPSKALYWNGARVEGNYPMSIVLDHHALNITMTRYVDQIDFGLIACRRTLPHMQRLLDYLEDSLADLEAAIPATTRRRTRTLNRISRRDIADAAEG